MRTIGTPSKSILICLMMITSKDCKNWYPKATCTHAISGWLGWCDCSQCPDPKNDQKIHRRKQHRRIQILWRKRPLHLWCAGMAGSCGWLFDVDFKLKYTKALIHQAVVRFVSDERLGWWSSIPANPSWISNEYEINNLHIRQIDLRGVHGHHWPE